MASNSWVGGISAVLVAAMAILLVARVHGARDLEPAPTAALEHGGAPPPLAQAGGGYLGVIVAEESADISSQQEGRLERLPVQVGDAVKRGDVLAALESKSLERELAVAEAELLSARADLKVAELGQVEAEARLRRREDPRQLSLGALSEEEVATARYEQQLAAAKKEGAQARVLQQEARAAQLRQRLADAIVRAPFDGLVANRYMDPGKLIRTGEPIVHLLRSGTQQVRFAVPEEAARRVTTGLAVRIVLGDESRALDGQIAHVAPEVDAASRMVLAIANLENPPAQQRLPAGTVVRVAVLEAPDAGARSVAEAGRH